MLAFQPQCQPLILGPLPHHNAASAWALVQHTLPRMPVLPVLAGADETPASLSLFGLAGLHTGDVLRIERQTLTQALPSLDAAFLRGTSDDWEVDLAAIAGLEQHAQTLRRSRALIGCMAGPISLALQVVDEDDLPIAQDRILLGALAQHLFLRRAWLHTTLRQANERVLVWLYEPYADMLRSPFCPASFETLAAALDQALGYDQPRVLWVNDPEVAGQLLHTMRLDLIGLPLPAPNQAATFAPLVRRLINERSGTGWGVVPVNPDELAQTSVGGMAARFDQWVRALEAHGLAPQDIATVAFIMPQETLAQLDEPAAERILALTANVASVIRQSYAVEDEQRTHM